jgi:hypothetical protein
VGKGPPASVGHARGMTGGMPPLRRSSSDMGSKGNSDILRPRETAGSVKRNSEGNRMDAASE